MTTRINPDSMYNSLQFGFSHAAMSEPGRLLHLAGQVAWDSEMTVVGGNDLAAQARQCLANLRTVLADQGLGPQHLVRLRTYVVKHTPDMLEPVAGAMMEFWGDTLPCPNTWIGVHSLAMPEFLIEIEATAAMP